MKPLEIKKDGKTWLLRKLSQESLLWVAEWVCGNEVWKETLYESYFTSKAHLLYRLLKHR